MVDAAIRRHAQKLVPSAETWLRIRTNDPTATSLCLIPREGVGRADPAIDARDAFRLLAESLPGCDMRYGHVKRTFWIVFGPILGAHLPGKFGGTATRTCCGSRCTQGAFSPRVS